MKRRALILGVTGMDGSHLADILLEKGYAVHGVHRHTSTGNLSRIEHLAGSPNFTLWRGDLTDIGSLYSIVAEVQPQELYNEADQDNVDWSRNLPGLAARVTFAAVADLFEMIRQTVPTCRIFQPCSSTMFGDAPAPQCETTPFNPQSPYAVAKTAAFYLSRMVRQQYGMFVSTAILFNHTSPRQTEEYLLRKICTSAVRIARGQQKTLALGNLDTMVDVGCARQYMEAAHAMLQLDEPGEYIVASGDAWPIATLVQLAFNRAGIRGGNLFDLHVVRDPQFYRGTPAPPMQGDTRKIRAAGIDPRCQIGDLIARLVKHAEGELP